MSKYKVLVVDDSAFMRKMISDLIAEDVQFSVLDTAKNGAEAVAKANLLKPDVITMDIEMPVMNGLEAVHAIMREQPTPIIMLSSLTQEGAWQTIQALELGAVDFIRKPSGSISLDIHKIKTALHSKLRAAVLIKKLPSLPDGGVKVGGQAGGKTIQARNLITQQPVSPTEVSNRKTLKEPFERKSQFRHLVAVGTSTGGPRALQQLLMKLPRDFPAPIVVVQHMPPKFTRSLAERLNSLCAMQVMEAEDDTRMMSGTVYIAPGGFHMTVKQGTSGDFYLHLNKEKPRSGHRPSVDTLFDSLVPYKQLKRHVILMTGMGSDGAKGMKALADSGAETTIAESDETCVVYGMPRSAVELKCTTHVLPLYEISEKLIDIICN